MALIRHSSFVIRHSCAGRFSWPAAFTLIALIIASLIGFLVYRTETWPMRTAHQGISEAERVAASVRDAFVSIAHLQPRIRVNDRVYLEETTPTSEFAVISRRIEVEHELVHSWLGSSKRVKLHGTFAIKAGFDLSQGLAVDVRPEEIVIRLPPAQLLGTEQEQLEVLVFENGFWNRISADDVQNELSILPHLAREKALASNLPAEAERSLQQQLKERIHTERPLRLLFTASAKKD
ncbi:MAG: DUF4230 domain-containing protein [Chthoniobacterales bacterium]